MAWSKLDDGFHENAKIGAMSDKAFRLYVCAITYGSRHRLFGRLSFSHVTILFRLTGAKQRQADELVGLNAWHEVEGGFLIHGFTEYNPSAEEISAKRSEAGRKGAESRWQNGKPMASATSPDSNEEWQIDGKGTCAQTRAWNPDPVPIPESHTHTQNPEPDQTSKALAASPRHERDQSCTIPPSKDDVASFFDQKSTKAEGRKFWNHYEANGWMVGKNKMRNWHAAAAGWIERENGPGNPLNGTGHPNPNRTLDEMKAESMAELRRLGIGE